MYFQKPENNFISIYMDYEKSSNSFEIKKR